jgi:2-dehydro-3-deoxygluconokinase
MEEIAKIEVVSLGECMALAFPPQPVGLEESAILCLDIAGAESNLCIGLSRLGVKARFISRVGDDPFGKRIRLVLEHEGVDTQALLATEGALTGVFFREHFPDGLRRVYYYRLGSAASRLCPEDLQAAWFEGARLVHLTGITPALSPSCAAACQRAIEIARQVGAQVSFDPNYRPALWQPAQARLALLPLIEQVDILLMGHEDAAAIFNTPPVLNAALESEVLHRAAGLGVGLVVLKRGERGACALVEDEITETPAVPVRQVVDPVGAGDGFDAGFLAGWLRGDSLEGCLRLGTVVGAAAVGVMGDYAGYPRQSAS